MNTILKTNYFTDWFKSLKDLRGRAAIQKRIDRAEEGNFGDYKSVGDGVFEMRLTVGPGYRVYYSYAGSIVYILLLGGDKSSQVHDIAKAKSIWNEIQKENENG